MLPFARLPLLLLRKDFFIARCFVNFGCKIIDAPLPLFLLTCGAPVVFIQYFLPCTGVINSLVKTSERNVVVASILNDNIIKEVSK